MKIIIGSDHNGYNIKKEIIKKLKNLKYEIEDKGAYNEEAVDYPILAKSVCDAVLGSDENLGILICGTGIGMSIAANKIKGIRCAKADTKEEAGLTKQHNNANVLAVSSKKSNEEIVEIVLAFIKSEFSFEERHIRRIKEISDLEA